MIVHIKHDVIFKKQRHRFVVDVECPLKPDRDFTFVFRGEDSGDDCALIVEEVYGWDATRNKLLVRTIPWDLDEWHSRAISEEPFDAVKRQLIDVVGCQYTEPDQDVSVL
ncbi:hypothetical protein OAS39_10730 [Pirellulales bacterium]|nr:hypothetical protein [Pirellulales bacterium]